MKEYVLVVGIMKTHRKILTLIAAPTFVLLFWAWFPSYYNSMLKLGAILQTHEQGDNRIEKD